MSPSVEASSVATIINRIESITAVVQRQAKSDYVLIDAKFVFIRKLEHNLCMHACDSLRSFLLWLGKHCSDKLAVRIN